MGSSNGKQIETNHGRQSVDTMPLLHGRLAFYIDRAEKLPDIDTSFFNIDHNDYTDPFVVGELGPQWLFKTKYINNTLNPVWDEKFSIPVCQKAEVITISVRDKEHWKSVPLGSFTLTCDEVLKGERIDDCFDLKYEGEPVGKIRMSVQYFPKDEEDRLSKEVPDAYFPMRENNRLTLYQDADTPQLPQFEGVVFPDGTNYEPTRAWLDLFNAIKNAQKFIYVTGWSVFTNIQLVRGEEDTEGESHVGELLKKKAEEGVRVLVLLWNEACNDTPLWEGKMGTHDEETRKYFEDSNVHCILASRQHADGGVENTFSTACYTHHQKTVICDAEDEESGLRRVIAFIGGLDITNGRYDTCEFPLFSTLNSLHKGDFYSNCVVGVTAETGPREPWHDNHAKVEGPAALDIKTNFEERWKKQADTHVDRMYWHENEEFALDSIVKMPENEGGYWNLQLFRSITSDSCILDESRQNILHTKGGRIVENSIMRCMVHQIRNAKNFIYMENQYFLGSACEWEEKPDTLAHHIVPTEIAQRIIDKIYAGEDFKAYILIPMFPEGLPSDGPIQEILHWQHLTMNAMYKKIAKAIQENELDTKPKDYLQFFCLGKQEGPEDVPVDELGEPEAGSEPAIIRSTLRHSIYVHSKMTIIDDDYVLIGSANINQRSLAGERDTEIAIGGYQPSHTVDGGDPRGDIHTYRMALWASHFGGYDEVFLNPGSQECMAKVTEITQSYWDLYSADEPEHSNIHMLPYPIKVEEDGTVTNLDPPFDCFPDTSANVLGQLSTLHTISTKITT